MNQVFPDPLQIELAALLVQPAIAEQTPALRKLGAALHQADSIEAALAAFEALAGSDAEDAALWQTITGLSLQLQLPQHAYAAAQRAVEMTPASTDAWFNLGLLAAEVGDAVQAVAAYQRALDIDPHHYGSMRNLPLLLSNIGRHRDAREADARLLHEYRDDPWLHFNSGDLLIGMRAGEQAEAAFRHALRLTPDFHRARYGLAIALAQQGRITESVAERTEALTHEPGLLHDYKSPLLIDSAQTGKEATPERVAVAAAFEELRMGDWHRYDAIVEMYARLIRGEEGRPMLDELEMVHSALSLPLGDKVQHLFANQAADGARKRVAGQSVIRPPRRPDRRLNIAYFSADFRPHPTAYLMGSIYARHDRERFKIHAYSLSPVQDSKERTDVIESCEVFRDIGRLPAAAAAQMIINDGIDILVDLTGYTTYTRPEVLALRPAPLQLSYLGFMGTLGKGLADYVFLDREVLLPSTREYWDESIAYIPHCSYHCELPSSLLKPPSRSELGLPLTGLVLGALHHPRKLEPMTWACWMDVLHALPDAILWLLYETEEQREQLLRNAEQHGIGQERLVFSTQVEHGVHLARLSCADLFLDTFVYNGHTTTIDALGAGVPVVTLSGESVVARVAGSMLKAHGLSELVAKTEAEYRGLVLRLATDTAWRSSLRERASNYGDSNLFCPERKIRQIETAYEMMWARHQAGLPPEDFDVPDSGWN